MTWPTMLLGVDAPAQASDAGDEGVARERLFLRVEPALLARAGSAAIGPGFDFARWSPEGFSDGQFVRAEVYFGWNLS